MTFETVRVQDLPRDNTLDGTESIPVLDGTTTKQVTVQDILDKASENMANQGIQEKLDTMGQALRGVQQTFATLSTDYAQFSTAAVSRMDGIDQAIGKILPPGSTGQVLMHDGTKWGAASIPTQSGVSSEYVTSFNGGLISNGFGNLRNNSNFSNFTYDPSDAYAGFGSFVIQGRNNDLTIDQPIPVELSGTYELSYAIKATGGKFYSYAACLDIDGQIIGPHHVKVENFRLARPVNRGDTSIWINLEDIPKLKVALQRYDTNVQLVLFDGHYTSASGLVYPPGTYSRKQLCSYTRKNALTLDENTGEWKGFNITSTQEIPAGNICYFGVNGGTYIYWSWVASNVDTPTEWTMLKDRIVLQGLLRPYTSFIKIGWLCNRGTEQHTTKISAVNFRQVRGGELLGSYRIPVNYLPPEFAQSEFHVDIYPERLAYRLKLANQVPANPTGSVANAEIPSGFRPVGGGMSINLPGGGALYTDLNGRLAYMSATPCPPGLSNSPVIPLKAKPPFPRGWVQV